MVIYIWPIKSISNAGNWLFCGETNKIEDIRRLGYGLVSEALKETKIR